MDFFIANIGPAYVNLRCLYLNAAAWKTGLIEAGKIKVLLDGEKGFLLEGYLNPRGGLEGMENLYERLKLKEGMKLRYSIPKKNTILIYGLAYSKHEAAAAAKADTLNRPLLRKKLEQALPTIGLFDAFCLDYFPMVKRAFSSGMDRTERTNLLLEHIDCGEVGEKLLEFLSNDSLRPNSKPL